ncbi:MAG: SAM domain-containing protein [Hyphomicrobiales bacterium]
MTCSRAARDRLRPRGRLCPTGETGVDIAAWPRGLGLGPYETAFRDNDIDAEVVPELAEVELEKIGVASLGPRKRLLKAIAALRTDAAPLMLFSLRLGRLAPPCAEPRMAASPAL